MKYKGFTLKNFVSMLKNKKTIDRAVLHFENMETGGTITDKTGKGNNGTVQGTITNTTVYDMNCKTFAGEGYIDIPYNNLTSLYPYFLNDALSSFFTGCHQGVAGDGTNFYVFDTTTIKKYDENKTLILTNANASTEVGVDHIGDGCYYDGKIYVACADGGDSNYCTGVGSARIGVWDASTLTFIRYYDISASTTECSGCAIDQVNGFLYTTNYCDGTKIWKFNLSDLSYVGTITLSEARTNPQGIEYYDSQFYISASNTIYIYNSSGTLLTYPAQGKLIPNLVGGEGIYVQNGSTIWVMNDNAENGEIKRYYENDNAYTIILWVYLPYLPSEIPAAVMRLFGSKDSYIDFYYLKSTPSLYCKANISTAPNRPYILESSGLLKKNAWMMLTYTFEGKTPGNFNKNKIYVDSGQTTANSSINTALPPYPHATFTIGGEETTNPTYRLYGTVGQFTFIKGKALSPQEVVNYYNATKKNYGL